MPHDLQQAEAYLTDQGDLLAELTSREDQLLTLRDWGESLAAMPEALRTPEAMVPGCASATYIVCEIDTGERVRFTGYSESFISRGYIHVLLEALNGLPVQIVLSDVEPSVMAFAEKSGARMSMIASRANVFERIFRFMQKTAIEAAGSTTDHDQGDA